MMNCDYVERHLDAVMDGEVDASGRMAVDQHLSECSKCAEQLAFARAVKAHLKESASVLKAPAGLRERVEATLAVEQRPSVRIRTSWRSTLSVAAAAVVIFGLGGAIQLRGHTEMAAVMPLVEDIVRVHKRQGGSEVARTDEVPYYFAQKVGFPVHVRTRDPNIRFEGARFASVGGRRAATLVYRVNGRRMTVVAFRTPRALFQGQPMADTGARHHGREVRVLRAGTHTVPLVEHDGVTYAIVGDMDPEARVALLERAGL